MYRFLILVLFGLVFACRPKKAEAQSPLEAEMSAESPATPLPAESERSAVDAPAGPERAAAARKRVLPELNQALEAKGLKLGSPVFLRGFKEEGELELWMLKPDKSAFVHFRTWPIAAQSGSLGPKLAEGDMQVPEGFYVVNQERMKPDSQFHLAFNIGYPNAYDRAHQRTGTYIMVHGNQCSIGCLAMTDERIEEIYTLCDAALESGQPYFRVHLFPFRMTPERMSAARESQWFEFWQNLKEGYDFFERDRLPPDVQVEGLRYGFKRAETP